MSSYNQARAFQSVVNFRLNPPVGVNPGEVVQIAKGSSIKDVRKKDPFSYPLTPVRRSPHLINPSPLCGRPHLASYTALWSDIVIVGALKIRCSLVSSSGHFTPTPCGLICGSCN